MKIRNLLIFFATALVVITTNAQSNRIPSIMIKNLEGQCINTSEFQNDGKPYVVSFWATWCRPCLKELTAIDEIYEDWLEEGFKLIAISTDNARTKNNVMPMVKGRGWQFEFYSDENGDLQRAMGVNMIPHTFILDANGNIIEQHRAFSDGMEWEMFEKLKKIMNESKVETPEE
ncbi:MAG: TlpA family protein disulfide reductase [Bacteroidetes bacterium]|nr:TlpA family protein disulfide reductase [Bacteroidota bacterium]